MVEYIALAIRMNQNCDYSNNVLDIDSIYFNDNCWYKKGTVHDYVKNNPNKVVVGNNNGPKLIPCISNRGEKYVKSTPNNNWSDNLLALPRV